MSDAPPPRRTLPRIPLAAAVGAALVVGLVGYAIGHGVGAGVAGPAATSSACTAATQAAAQQMKAAQGDPSNTTTIRTVNNLILQNRDCFDPGLVASAQTLLDLLDQGAAADAARDAVCAASDEPRWSC